MTEPTFAAYAPAYSAPLTEPTGSEDVLLAPAELAEPGPTLRPLVPLAVIASCLLHAGAAAMFISNGGLPEFGVLDTKSEAFSLQTMQTIVLELTMSEPVDTAAAAAAAMPQGTVQSVDAEPEPLKAAEPGLVENEPPPKTVQTTEVVPEETSEDPLEVIKGSSEPADTIQAKAAEQKAEETQDDEQKQRREKRRKEAQRQRSKHQTAGGPAARAVMGTAAVSGRVSASRGSILSYAARVRAQVARNKPPGKGRQGIAKVAFGISASGDLSYAQLSESSGNSALDQAALSAVQRAAPFGAPPPGATSAQLRFSIPFYFR